MGFKTLNQLAQINSIDVSSDDLLLIYDQQAAAPTKSVSFGDLETLIRRVDSVNGQTGAVVLNTDHVSEGTTNKYVTAAQINLINLLQSGGAQDEFLAADGNYRQPANTETGIDKVQTIAARDALGITEDMKLVYVDDASADPAVSSGSVLYYYDSGSGSFKTVSDGIYLKKTGDTFSGTLTVTGDLIVQGSSIQIDTEITTTDAVILMNNGEAGAGVTLGYSGVHVDRGTADDFWMGFDEVRDTFTVGQITSLSAAQIATTQVIATRENAPTDGSIQIWDNTNTRLTSSNLSISGSTISSTTNQVLFGDGVIGTPSIAAASNPDAGIYWNDSMRFVYGGTEAFRVHSSGTYLSADLRANNGQILIQQSNEAALLKGIRLEEIADHIYTPTATYGQIWVKNDAPNTLWFTDDDGTDYQLGAGGATIGGNTNRLAYKSGTDTTATLNNFRVVSGNLFISDGADFGIWTGTQYRNVISHVSGNEVHIGGTNDGRAAAEIHLKTPLLVSDAGAATSIEIAAFHRQTTATPADGIGGYITIGVEGGGGVQPLTIEHRLNDESTSTEDSLFIVSGQFSSTLSEFMAINSGGSGLVGYGLYAVNMGIQSSAEGNNGLALSRLADASGANATSLGFDTTASNTDSTAVGAYAVASGVDSFAGGDATASGTVALAMMNNASATADSTIAIGESSGANFQYNIAIGAFTQALTAGGAIAIGRRSNATAQGAIIMGYHTTAQTNSLSDSFKLMWDGSTDFWTGPLKGTKVTTNSNPDTNVTSAENGSIVYDTDDHEYRAYVNGAWGGLVHKDNSNDVALDGNLYVDGGVSKKIYFRTSTGASTYGSIDATGSAGSDGGLSFNDHGGTRVFSYTSSGGIEYGSGVHASNVSGSHTFTATDPDDFTLLSSTTLGNDYTDSTLIVCTQTANGSDYYHCIVTVDQSGNIDNITSIADNAGILSVIDSTGNLVMRKTGTTTPATRYSVLRIN